MRLLTRTTRSVSPTDVGEQLLAELRPALSDIRGVLTTLSGFSPRPSDGYGSYVPASPRGPSSGRSWGGLCATTRGLSLRLPPTIPGSILCRPATMRGFSSANTSRRTWWPFGYRRTSAQPSLAHPPTSNHTRSRRRLETC